MGSGADVDSEEHSGLCISSGPHDCDNCNPACAVPLKVFILKESDARDFFLIIQLTKSQCH
jgi:hypothetical protein